MIEAAVLIPAMLIGLGAYLAAYRWPDPIGAPRVDTATVRDEVQRHPALAALLRTRTDPAELTGLALTVAAAACLLAAGGIGLLLAMIRTGSGFARWDAAFARFGATHATAGSTTFLRDISLLGGTVGVIVIGVLIGLVEVRRTRTFALLGFLVLACGGQFAIANLLKVIVNRDRPDILPLTGFSGSSFPSGHATAAAAVFMTAAFLIGRRRSRRVRAALVGGAVAIACCVAASRVLLGVHWFTDVIAGLLLGWAWFAICSMVFGGRILRYGAPIQQAQASAPPAPVPH
ncbi:phosphatase PAP2 family protein [Aquihabitans sp. McL0605]|uniref:phosphatase PAP2 family protein n=1 Tax=Aquihabitans sp. McL0605 TaxID=3415671 RepID=UPI003CF12667